MSQIPLRVWSAALWCVAFMLWLAADGLTIERFTIVFWIVTGLVAFTLGTRPWWQAPLDWAPIIVFFLAYDYTRGAALRLGLPTHWEGPVQIDRVIGFGQVPTVWLQERFAAPDTAVPWWEVIPALTYVSHFFVPFVLGGVLWVASRPTFQKYMLRLALISLIGVIGYVVVPAAPPWAAARCTHDQVAAQPSQPVCLFDDSPEEPAATVLGPLDRHQDGHPPYVTRISSRGVGLIPGLRFTEGFIQTGIDGSNPVAAVPSLHAAGALFVSMFLWPLLRRRWRPVLVAYPLVMAAMLVWGGDHYVIDILLGWLVVAVSMAAAAWIERWWAARRKSPEPVLTA